MGSSFTSFLWFLPFSAASNDLWFTVPQSAIRRGPHTRPCHHVHRWHPYHLNFKPPSPDVIGLSSLITTFLYTLILQSINLYYPAPSICLHFLLWAAYIRSHAMGPHSSGSLVKLSTLDEPEFGFSVRYINPTALVEKITQVQPTVST